jgi:hypothetical protein|nr:MAG TPA: hypothetical protein [Caudoviricetes sp.]
MILLQKFDEHNRELKAWTRIFKNEDELLEFLEKNKEYLFFTNRASLYIEKVNEEEK